MDDKTKSSTAASATSMKPTGVRSKDSSYNCVVQNLLLVWLDASIDQTGNHDHHSAMKTLRQVVNTINIFTNADECIDFITDTNIEKIFMIVSESFSQIIVPVVQGMSQVNSVCIFGDHKERYELWSQQWSKVNGAFTDIIPICEALKQAAHQCSQNSVSLSFIKSTDELSKKTLDELDQSFMYTQIVKEVLLTTEFSQTHINEFIVFCREQSVGNETRLKDIDKLEKEYRDHQPIWWYTCGYFLYSMLNDALRTMEVDLIIRIGFFVRDLHQNIAQLYSAQYGGQKHLKSFTVFRGQGLSQPDFDQLMKTRGGLLSFNNFLSTSLDKEVSTAFAESNQSDPNLVGVLFKITVDPSIPSTPFGDVAGISQYGSEGEILFSMHSVFRIGQINQIDGNDRLWQVELTLTSDNDPQLHALTKRIREETFPREEGWYRLGQVLIKLGHFNKAQQVYETLLSQRSDALRNAGIYFQLGWIKDNQGEYERAIACYEKLGEINEKTLPQNHPKLASTWNNAGILYNKMGDYSKALSSHQKALELRQRILAPDDSELATSYNNIATVYDNMGQYSNALSSFGKALEIWQKTIPLNHPDFATLHNNIGTVYIRMSEYSRALWHFQKAHEIQKKALPPNHPDVAVSHNNLGGAYGNMGQYSNALSCFEKALESVKKTVSSKHPKLATFYNNIASMYDKMGENWKALFYFQTACEIQQKALPANHPHLGASYNNIGIVYVNIGKRSNALSYFKKALKIFDQTLPANHPQLATAYNNIGLLYNVMGEYSKALLYYEKVLKISQETLPSNHPLVANFYNNIGGVYEHMGNYSKALSYFERALEIGKHSLPGNYLDLQVIRRNLERVRMQL